MKRLNLPERKFLKRIKLKGYDRELLIFKFATWRLGYHKETRLSRIQETWSIGPYVFVINDWTPY